MDFQKLKLQILPFLKNYKKIGIMISGGFDSGLLLYVCLLIKQQENLSVQITAVTVPRHDDSMIHSYRIVSWINEIFSYDIHILNSGNPFLHHSLQVWSGVIEQENNFDFIFMGCTKNPPNLPNGPLRPKASKKNVYQPFLNFSKKDTVKLAIDLRLTDLMILSHSCTESKLLRCNHCWQCKERKWAFEVNNFTDPGTM